MRKRERSGDEVRTLPLRLHEFTQLAVQAGLSNPVGRACYGINRRNNGDLRIGEDATDKMRRCKASTADKWLQRFLDGGTLKHSH